MGVQPRDNDRAPLSPTEPTSSSSDPTVCRLVFSAVFFWRLNDDLSPQLLYEEDDSRPSIGVHPIDYDRAPLSPTSSSSDSAVCRPAFMAVSRRRLIDPEETTVTAESRLDTRPPNPI